MNRSGFRLVVFLVLGGLLPGCVFFPTRLPKDRATMAYSEVTTFMRQKTDAKSERAYSRLNYLRAEQGHHVLEGTVSPAPIKFTPFGVDRYLFRVHDSEGLPDPNSLLPVHGEEKAMIRDFFGPFWEMHRSEQD